MRPDQLERLTDLAESIGEVFLEEADPQNWNGAGLPLSGIDQETRGNRYWDKKNAIQTGTLLARVLDLADRNLGHTGAKKPDDEIDDDIDKYEKKAKELLKGIQAKTAKVDGKAH